MNSLRYVLLVNSLLVVVSMGYYLLLRHETFFRTNRIVLWLGMVAALSLPMLELPDWRPQPVRTVMQRTAQVIIPKVLPPSFSPRPDVIITFPNGRAFLAFSEQPVSLTWSWQLGLLVMYALGVLFLLARFGIRLLSLGLLIRRSAQENYESFTLICTHRIVSPFSFFNWVVINPEQHSPNELEQVLRHERVHVLAVHSLDMIGAELICILFWFNPAAYLFRYLIHQALEFSADEAVLAEGVDEKAYQYSLLSVGLLANDAGFMNQFSGPSLRQRIAMINRERSGSRAWGRYVFWFLLMGTMAVACRRKLGTMDEKPPVNALAAISPTRALVVALEDKNTWHKQTALYNSKTGTKIIEADPVIVQLKGNKFVIADDYRYSVGIHINGGPVPVEALEKLSPEFVDELFVMQQWEDMAGTDLGAKPFQVLIQTSSNVVPFNGVRKHFFTLLQAAAISKHPLGDSYSFSMNQLLEATFFHNKDALVERTKNEHLKVYDEYKKDVEIFINDIPAKPADVETVHVREVARLHTKERPYTEWFHTDNAVSRFELHILTTPKRAKRDTSYYVFSPFYTGDF
ncbi:M56 family metallopeptidase [Spirosoma sp. SC4-14]|uniref:M56 family metallopeptidase n=1 Tax=Spirosoma sp. SC4-14 TaxID=3128900 RepID=UPI0030D4D275